MTKKELLRVLDKYNDDDVVVCMDENGGWDNIYDVFQAGPCIAIGFGGGSPFSSDNQKTKDSHFDRAKKIILKWAGWKKDHCMTVPQCKCHLDITDKKTCPLLGDECDRADDQIGDLLCDGCRFIND